VGDPCGDRVGEVGARDADRGEGGGGCDHAVVAAEVALLTILRASGARVLRSRLGNAVVAARRILRGADIQPVGFAH
jgi:hypothetical protein